MEVSLLRLDCVIEIPQGGRCKYEHVDGRLRLDRVLYSALAYPAEYGFIPETRSPDGDPLDIVVAMSVPTFPGCVIPARIVGGLEMIDQGEPDTKIVAVCAVDPRYDHIHTLDDFGPHFTKEIVDFFSSYKRLEGKVTTMGALLSRDQAEALVAQARAAHDALQPVTRNGNEPEG